MDDFLEDKRRAEEEQYFGKKNKEALARLRARHDNKPRPSPITGEPMEQLTYMGVIIDRCPKTGGIWLDAGELEQIMAISESKTLEMMEGKSNNLFRDFFGFLKK